jgi:hypothetical protein
MPRIGTTDAHAELAVSQFGDILNSTCWGLDNAWLAISQLLMTCKVWRDHQWVNLPVMPPGCPVLMESNNYRLTKGGQPNRNVRDATAVRDYMAARLGVSPEAMVDHLGRYFGEPGISHLQPNNPRGHGFRSLIAETLSRFGDPALRIDEEVKAHELFPGQPLQTRSDDPKIDIVVHRGPLLVAMVSTRWTYRHDRVDMIDEAHAYVPPARHQNPHCTFYGATAEIVTARLRKVLRETEAVQQHGVITGLVHLHAPIASSVIGRNGDLVHLVDLVDFVNQSYSWH